MVYRYQLTYNQIIDRLDLKNIPTTTLVHTLPPGIYEIIDINFMLKSLFPKELKVKITVDDVRLRSNLTTNKTNNITKKFLFLHNSRFYSIPFG